MDMDIPKKLNQHRQQISIAIAASVIIGLVGYAAPRIVNILTYFWPLLSSTAVLLGCAAPRIVNILTYFWRLLASTAVLLVVIVGFGGLSQLATEAHGEKAGEGLLDYVPGARTQHIAEPQ